ncbi:MAG: sensor histidine kinase [Vicinamibacterales bacterium]
MSTPHQPRWARVAAAGAALVVFAIAASVLAGWKFDIAALKGPFGEITMKTNAALGLLVCALAVWSLLVRLPLVGLPLAAFAIAIGTATLIEHLSGWDLGIDQLLFSEEPGAVATSSPNRMGLNGSTNFVLAGTAIWLLFHGTPRAIAWGQRLAFGGAILALLAIAGYAYDVAELYSIARFTGIAFHTALALITLHCAVLLARVDYGPMALFADEGVAGMLLRRLSAPIVITPLTLGYLAGLGRRIDLFDRGLSLALYSVTVIVVFGWIVWETTATIYEADARRRRAERDRDLLLVSEREARDEAERASRLKDQFIAVLSHELRTPLNVMLGWIQVIENELSPERHARAAAIVARNGRVLTRLVEDLLDVSRVTAGQFELARRPMSFTPVVQNAVDAFAPRARERGVELRASFAVEADVLEGDAERLQQIVSNLLSNALKFTPAGGRVDVSTAIAGRELVLTVTDTGIGFDATFQGDLFQPFRQADSSPKREHGGLGLGLSIAKHIAELHGGKLSGSSPGRGGGATFTLRLPLAPIGPGEQRQVGVAMGQPG